MAVAAPFKPEQNAPFACEIAKKAQRSKTLALDIVETSGERINSGVGDEIGTFLAWWKSDSRIVGVWSEENAAEYDRLVLTVAARHEAFLAEKYGIEDLTSAQRNFVYASVWGRNLLFDLIGEEAHYAQLAKFALGSSGQRHVRR